MPNLSPAVNAAGASVQWNEDDELVVLSSYGFQKIEYWPDGNVVIMVLDDTAGDINAGTLAICNPTMGVTYSVDPASCPYTLIVDLGTIPPPEGVTGKRAYGIDMRVIEAGVSAHAFVPFTIIVQQQAGF